MSRHIPFIAVPLVALAAGCAATPPPAPQSIHFDSASAVVQGDARKELRDIAAYLSCDANAMAAVGGHTDSVGADAYNQRLSQRRAEAVRKALIEEGAPDDRVTLSSHGESAPIADNQSAVGRQLNRRSTVVVHSRGEPHCGGASAGNAINRTGPDYIATDNLQ